MRFVSLAVVDIGSMLGAVAISVALASSGAYYWSLVFGQLALAAITAASVWTLSGWRPGLPTRRSGVRTMLVFRGHLTGFSIVNYWARNLDNLLIGRVWGPSQLGLYSRAYQLLLVPIDQANTPVAAVAVPALSRLGDSPERYRQAYLHILEKLAMVTMPMMAFLIATSDWMVHLVLGSQWLGVSSLFAWLGIAGLVQPLANTTGWLFITQARTATCSDGAAREQASRGLNLRRSALGRPWRRGLLLPFQPSSRRPPSALVRLSNRSNPSRRQASRDRPCHVCLSVAPCHPWALTILRLRTRCYPRARLCVCDHSHRRASRPLPFALRSTCLVGYRCFASCDAICSQRLLSASLHIMDG